MSRIYSTLVLGVFSLIFIFEAIAIPNTANVIFYLWLLLPLLLTTGLVFTHRTVHIPKTVSRLLFAYLLISLLTVLFSTNLERSLNNWLIQLTAGLFFVYGYNEQERIRKIIPPLIVAVAIILSLYSLWLNHNLNLNRFLQLLPNTGYNLVYSTYRFHNHLGDLLVLPLIINFYYLIRGRYRLLNFVSILFFLPQLICSYSRSAYLALVVVGIVMIWHKRHKLWQHKTILSLIMALLILVLGYGLSITTETKQFSWQGPISKLALNGRNFYWRTALLSIRERPLTGVGLGNFFYASSRHSNTPFEWVETSLNVFLNQLTETGVFASSVFLILILIVILSLEFNLGSLLFLGLLINFQTDYTYALPGLWLLFWLFAGAGMRPARAEIIVQPARLLTVTIIPLLFFLLFWVQNWLIWQQQYFGAWMINPTRKKPYEYLISASLLDRQYTNAHFFLKLYERLFNGDTTVQTQVSNYYYALGDKPRALLSLKRAYYWHPYEGMFLYKKLYYLERQLNGARRARWVLRDYQQKLAQIPKNNYRGQELKADFVKFQQSHND